MSEGRWPVGWPELVAPFPYFGGKRRAAPIIWRELGDPAGYVEPFAGARCCHVAVYDKTAPDGVRDFTVDEAWIRDEPAVKRVLAALAESFTAEEAIQLLKPDRR